MSSENKSLILHFDIFKNRSNISDIYIPDYGDRILSKLKSSLIKLQNDAVEKYIIPNEPVPKVINELEKSLNSIFKKQIICIKSIENSKKIKLGELYNFSVRNNLSLKKHLNSIYLISRVYKELYRDHSLMDNLKLRLISVRCKAIRDICFNESRRGKIRHLRCSKNPKFIPAMPKKLKSMLRKMKKELQKYANKELGVSFQRGDDIRKVLMRDSSLNWDSAYQVLEDVIVHYYKNVQTDPCKTDEYIKGLTEACRSQNKSGEGAVLNCCDQEIAMEYLMMNGDDIQNEFWNWDRFVEHGKVDGRNSCLKNEEMNINDDSMEQSSIDVGHSGIQKSIVPEDMELGAGDMDILDLENFQLVDVWEEKNDEFSINQSKTIDLNNEKKEDNDEKAETGKSRTRKKRQSRFAPLTDEDILTLYYQQQMKTPGFCSTFVDETVVNEKLDKPFTGSLVDESDNQKSIDDANIKQEQMAVSVGSKIDDKDKNQIETIPKSSETISVNFLDKGEICKAMLRKFHDSIKEAIESSPSQRDGKDWDDFVQSVMNSWSGEKFPKMTSQNAQEVSKEIFCNIQSKINVLERDFIIRSRKLSSVPIICGDQQRYKTTSNIIDNEQSPSPTPFDQSIEMSMMMNRKTIPAVPPISTHNVVARRSHAVSKSSDGQSSPERTRLRAMMLSYKRDVEKNRECSGTVSNSCCREDKKSQDSCTSNQNNTNVYDECGMAELIIKAQIEDHELKANHVSSEIDQKSLLHHNHHHHNTKSKEMKLDSKTSTSSDTRLSQRSGATTSSSSNRRSTKKQSIQETVPAADTESEGLLSSSDDEMTINKSQPVGKKVIKKEKAEVSRLQWLVPPPEAITLAPIPTPATPFLDDDNQSWTGRKVFVVDSHDKGSSMAHLVKSFLQKNNARVYDTTNYKQAGKDLHVLVHQDWRFPDSSTQRPDTVQSTSPISLLLLKNNSSVHFLSYIDVESVSRFSCQPIFPHSRSCIFLDHHALTSTHAENIRNMLEFMINERQNSNRIWCLKIPCSVYRYFSNLVSSCSNEAEMENLNAIQSILVEYSTKYSKDDSMNLVEIQTAGDEDIANQQDHVLNQQYFLQKKFRHFCILTDNLNTTELDIGFLSIYGVAVLPLNTFLTNKTGKYIKRMKNL